VFDIENEIFSSVEERVRVTRWGEGGGVESLDRGKEGV